MKRNNAGIIKNETNTRIGRLVFLLALVLIVLCIIRVALIMHQDDNKYATDSSVAGVDTSTDISRGWTLVNPDGSSEAIVLPARVEAGSDNRVVIKTKLEGIEEYNAGVKVELNRYGIEAYIDNKQIYQVNTTKVAKQLMYNTISLIELPDNSEGHELTLVFSGSKDGVYNLPSVSKDSIGAYRYSVARGEIYTLTLITFMIALGVVLLVTHFIYRHRGYNEPRLIHLAAFLILATSWGFGDSYIPLLIGISPEMSGIVCYSTLAVLVVPMVFFIWITCEKRGILLPAVASLGILNLIVQIALSLFGIVRLDSMIIVSHTLTFPAIVVSFAAIINEYRRRRESKDIAMTFYGAFFLAIAAVMTLFLYWVDGGTAYRDCLMTGMMIFVCFFFGGVTLKHNEERAAELEKLQLAEFSMRMSYIDPLTNLNNRRAFDEKLTELDKNSCSTGTSLIIMDLNGLKVTNDTYGHAAGDDMIATAARVIENAYIDEGSCYRIGGDEFAVILENPSVSLATLDKRLEAGMEKVNKTSKWKLSIARGSSYLYDTDGKRRTISDWKLEADVQMYRDKISNSPSNSRDMVSGLQDVINCVITTVEAKDMYTAAHSERVRELSSLLGTKLGLSESTVKDLEVASYLHDIGKIGVPDSVLKKPGRLSEEEFALMAKHCEIGSDIIGKAKGFKETAEIILHHHERFDGKGYPDGISGYSIPLQSRIIAVADSIDAMTSRRVYRDRLSLDDCREQLIKFSGKMYDPAIIQIALENWNEVTDIVLLHPKYLAEGSAK